MQFKYLTSTAYGRGYNFQLVYDFFLLNRTYAKYIAMGNILWKNFY